MKKKIVLTKKLATLYKLSIILGLTSLVLMIFFPLLFEENVGYIFFCVFFALMFVFGFIVFLFPFFVIDPNGVMKPDVKAEKYKASVTSFEDFLGKAEESVANKGFLKIKISVFEDYEIYLYAKPLKRSKLDLMLIIKADEVTSNILERSNETYVECLESHYGKNISEISSHISVSTIVCVNRINSALKNLVNKNLEQDFQISRFIAALSLGGKDLYVSKQKGGLAITRYKKHRKKFFEIFHFLIKNDMR